MTRRLVLVLLPLLLVACEPAPPDDATALDDATASDDVQAQAEAVRERLSTSEGGRLVLRAIEAHGGLEAWYAAPTSSYTWEYANTGADLQFETFLVADNRSRRVYHDVLSVGPYGDPRLVDGRMAWDGEDAWVYPDSITQINPRFWATTGYYFEQIPFVLADPGLRYEVLPPDTLGETTYEMVLVGFDDGVGDAPGDTYTLYVHPETGRVDAIRYTVTYGRDVDPTEPPSETLFTYEDYVTVDGLTVPTHFRGYAFDGQRGDFKNEAWADSISFRRPFDEAQLVAPAGARVAPPPGG